MASIFDLKTNTNELSSANEGTSRMEFDQHPATREISGKNFPGGVIRYKFQTTGEKWWVPSKSYIRMRCSLTRGDDAKTPLTVSDDVAPAMNMAPCMFQNMQFKINDKPISKIDDFVPQIESLEKRVTKSKAWLDSIGNSTNWWDSSFAVRQAQVTSDGKVNAANVPVTESVTTRVNLGYDASDQKAARHSVVYDETANTLTFALNASVTALPDNNVVWAVGDYVQLGAVIGDASFTGIRLRVAAIVSATVLTVESTCGTGLGAADDGQFDFQRVRANNQAARNISQFEITWTPSLSIFKVDHALPSGKYELMLTPQSQGTYQRMCVESLLADKVPRLETETEDANKYSISVDEMYFYAATIEGPRADDLTYYLDLEETRCQSDEIKTNAFQQKNFDVSASTYALTAAYQDLRILNDTRVSPSVFKSFNAALTSGDVELSLQRFFLNYAGQNLPAPDADPEFKASVDRTTERYTQSQIYTGVYFADGGAETIETYHDRGSYYYFSIPRDGTDRSTRANVHQQFSASNADLGNTRLLLFDHSKQVARIRVASGRVVQVDLENV